MNIKKITESYISSKWKIVEDLSIGSCHSTVYKITNGKKYSVLKIYFYQIDKNFEQKKKICEREIQYMKKLNSSPYIMNIDNYIPIQEIDRKNNIEYFGYIIQMPFVHCLGKSMADGKIFSVDEILKIGYDLSCALLYCNRQGIVHRDIKPFNIFFDDEKYILGDFGTAVNIEELEKSEIVKTLPYSAPELVIQGCSYDKTIDIYSLGIVLYELLNSNHIPFTCQGMKENEYMECIMKRIKGEPLPFVGTSQKLFKIIEKCCKYKKAERYKNFQDLINDIEKLICYKNL